MKKRFQFIISQLHNGYSEIQERQKHFKEKKQQLEQDRQKGARLTEHRFKH
ncbi:hypothetical protein [Xenorhabdus bovienii]|uniref:Uncharacterized protein n=1 Tax=Xenorhabdus bovienii str. feltiae Moldova TaxID=1398200 RepID=A0A077NW42_XENBV|nr:hypothetical protein [Xenorhabdus bovienii]CDH01831.1 hypothetical protein XBFM1_2330049 [Xenorhabdus bovienii str. feltiae Moldova]